MRVAFQGTVVTFPGGKRAVTIDAEGPVTVQMMLDYVGKRVARDEEVSEGYNTITDLNTVVEPGSVDTVTKQVDAG